MEPRSAAERSLFEALDRASDEPPIKKGYRPIAESILAPQETVLLALLGEGWTYVDSLVLATDQRVIRLRQGLTASWKLRESIPAADVTGATLRTAPFFGTVRIEATGGRSFAVQYAREQNAREFVDGLNALVRR